MGFYLYIRNIVISSLTSSLEWIDFALFGFFSPIFALRFFPYLDNTKSHALIAVYLVFAIGFVARPIGAVIFGHIGDKYGRTKALKITPLIFVASLFLLTLIPTYKDIGSLADILLVSTRIVQGIVLGGEFTGNIIYLCEVNTKWKYFWGSIGSSSGGFGILIASFMAAASFSFFNHAFLYYLGWKIIFWSIIPFGLISYYARSKITEPSIFKKNHNSINIPIVEVIGKHKKIFSLCTCAILLHASSFYFTFIFLPTFLAHIRKHSHSTSFLHNSFFIAFHLLLIPMFGFIANKTTGVKLLIFISILYLLLSYPLFSIVIYNHSILAEISILLFAGMSAFNAAIIPGIFTEIIPTNIRYTLFSGVFNIGFGIFGGLTPFVCFYIAHKLNSFIAPILCIYTLAVVTLIASILLLRHNDEEFSSLK